MTSVRPWKTRSNSGSLNAGKVTQKTSLRYYYSGTFLHLLKLINVIKQLCSLLFGCFLNSDATGSFPDYPDVEDGGSALIFAEKDPQQVKYTLIKKTWLIAYFFYSSLQNENDVCLFQLMEEIAAKEEEDSSNKPKGKEEKKEKGKKDKGKDDEEVRAQS